MLAFGNAGVQGGSLAVQGWLFDVKNAQSPQVLGKQYREDATEDNARLIAHRFADEIIFRLGGGIQGIAESKIYFVSSRGGTKEIWQMDYDGANQKQLTHLGTMALSPHVSPDGSRIAFSGVSNAEWQILMYSLELNRQVSFPRFQGTNLSPAWSSDGKLLAFSSSRSGDSEIYVVDVSGGNPRASPTPRAPTFRPRGIPRPTRRLRGSADAPACRRSTPWPRTAPTSCA